MSDLPVSVRQATHNFCGVEIRCHVLDDGRRIIDEASMMALLEALDAGARPTERDFEAYTQWQRSLGI